MIGLCTRHCPLELQENIVQVDFWFVPMVLNLSGETDDTQQ